MKRINLWITIVFFAVTLISFQGCATESISFKIKSTLPQDKLAYYNDSFDRLREDVWDKAGYMHSEPVRANFRQANMIIKDGKLRVDTQTGSFSKGGLSSRYVIKGDFDIQIDCHIDFLNEWQDMDQVLAFLVIDRGSAIEKIDSVVIGLAKGGGNNFRQVYSLQYINGIVYNRTPLSIGDFHGSLRIVRMAGNISTLYKVQGETEWRKLGTFRSTPSDVQLGFMLQNYTRGRTSITAKSPVTAKFDNFRINAAQEIIEEEI